MMDARVHCAVHDGGNREIFVVNSYPANSGVKHCWQLKWMLTEEGRIDHFGCNEQRRRY